MILFYSRKSPFHHFDIVMGFTIYSRSLHPWPLNFVIHLLPIQRRTPLNTLGDRLGGEGAKRANTSRFFVPPCCEDRSRLATDVHRHIRSGGWD